MQDLKTPQNKHFIFTLSFSLFSFFTRTFKENKKRFELFEGLSCRGQNSEGNVVKRKKRSPRVIKLAGGSFN